MMISMIIILDVVSFPFIAMIMTMMMMMMMIVVF